MRHKTDAKEQATLIIDEHKKNGLSDEDAKKMCNMHTYSNKHDTPTDANNVLVAGLSLIQAKNAAMIEGKKIRHRFFMADEYIYYKSGCWFTHDGYQIPDVYWLNASEQGWDDSWSVVS